MPHSGADSAENDHLRIDDPSEGREIMWLVERLGRIAHSVQFSEGLKPAQWEALRYIARAKRNSRSPGALADFMGNTRGSVSQTLKALETKGLIERGRENDDRRAVQLRLTPAGWEMMKEDPLESTRAAVNSSPEIHRSIVSAMHSILEVIQDHHGLPEFGGCTECSHFEEDDRCANGDRNRRCGISGEVIETDEVDRICTDFSRRRDQPERDPVQT